MLPSKPSGIISSNEGKMQIFIESLNGRTMTLDVNPNDTITNIKYLINDYLNIPFDLQKLYHSGKLLKGGTSTLIEHGIMEFSVITVMASITNATRESFQIEKLLSYWTSHCPAKNIVIIECDPEHTLNALQNEIHYVLSGQVLFYDDSHRITKLNWKQISQNKLYSIHYCIRHGSINRLQMEGYNIILLPLNGTDVRNATEDTMIKLYDFVCSLDKKVQ